MGAQKPVRVRVARNQATLIRLPEGQRVMNVYGADKGEGGLWATDAGKIPTRYLAVKPKDVGIHTTLHVISNTGEEISFSLEEVTGIDPQFDAEVDANSTKEEKGGATVLPEIKWVRADEVATCKARETAALAEAAETSKKAQAGIEATVATFESQYPRKLFFGYEWDRSKAARLGVQEIWSDDKFTYVQGGKVLALYEVNEDGKPSLVQYKYADGVYTIPKLLYDGYLAIGTRKENKLMFHRNRSRG